MKSIKHLLIFIFMILCLSSSVVSAEVSLNKTDITLIQGKSTHLKVTGTNKKVKWTSSKPSVAMVDNKGFVTGYKKGPAIITATVGGKKYTCSATIKPLTLNNVKSLTFNELLNLVDKNVISEDKLVSLIKGDSLSESAVIKLIKGDYISEARVLELLKENTLSQAGILQLINSNTLSKEDIIALIKSNTLTEERVRQIAANYSGGLSTSDVIKLINQYAPMAGTDWKDGTELQFIDKRYHLNETIKTTSHYYNEGEWEFPIDIILNKISIKKYRANNDVDCFGMYKYIFEAEGNINMEQVNNFRQSINNYSYTPIINFGIVFSRKDSSSENIKWYESTNTNQNRIQERHVDFDETTGKFKIEIIQKDINVNFDNFYIYINDSYYNY